ncbi:hypothetical protein JQC72_00735 [Polycladomyces sp. WAk]|uniref:Uncharacterized protein n=1 Tax=Polycladomyces zharkentensis TaxID=2807616 RepID=A0ABS2WEX0_9BACL|nr:hypothetical protein [Polycladomyces sp. WAk]MBN2908048.1 hypothetical protein [Polycladomyces sp. WAk]
MQKPNLRAISVMPSATGPRLGFQSTAILLPDRPEKRCKHPTRPGAKPLCMDVGYHQIKRESTVM